MTGNREHQRLNGAVQTRGGHGSGVPQSTPAGFCDFSDPDSLFSFDSSRNVCRRYENVIAYHIQTVLNFGCIDGFRSLNRTRILKFEKISNPD